MLDLRTIKLRMKMKKPSQSGEEGFGLLRRPLRPHNGPKGLKCRDIGPHLELTVPQQDWLRPKAYQAIGNGTTALVAALGPI